MEQYKLKLINDFVWLRSKVNFDFIFEKDTFSDDDIVRYYKKNKYLFYRLVGSKNGEMHIDISDDGIHRRGVKYQEYHEEKISEILKDDPQIKNVLELGSGQGANMAYLAKRHPDVKFTGIDLYPTLDKKNKKYDITLIQGDYHDLGMFEDSSFDMVYAVETLCYSQNKDQVFKEVNRVLKPDGLFIIYDAYLNKKRNELSEIEEVGAKLVESGYYLNQFEYVGNISRYIQNNGFEIVKAENMKNKVINHMKNYQARIKRYLKLGPLFTFFCKPFPKEVLGNIVPVYFMADTVEMDLSVYMSHILKNQKS
jgi:ubiquinone/menaquinone biosynthesis C-methylase UbiE